MKIIEPVKSYVVLNFWLIDIFVHCKNDNFRLVEAKPLSVELPLMKHGSPSPIIIFQPPRLQKLSCVKRHTCP